MRDYLLFFSRKLFFLKAYLRGRILAIRIKKIGRQVFIQNDCLIRNPSNIEIGNYVYINHHVEFQAEYEKIKIGNFVMIGPNTHIATTIHNYDRWDIPMYFQKDKYKSVIIEDDVWIGGFVFIMPGVTVGRGAVVGANAVVTKNVPPYSIMVGVPAKVMTYRFSKDKINKAKKLDMSQFLNKNKKDYV